MWSTSGLHPNHTIKQHNMESKLMSTWCLKTLLSLIFLSALIPDATTAPLSSYLKGVFRDDSNHYFNHFLVSNGSGTDYVYLGAVSTIYQLGTGLDLIRNESTGIDPPTNPDDCGSMCVNENKILAGAPPPVDRLILCRGADGLCEFRFFGNITRDGSIYGGSAQTTASVSSSVGIVARDTELYLFVAASSMEGFNGRVLYTIVKRVLEGDPKFSPVVQSVKAQGDVSYLQGLIWNGYIYFILHHDDSSKLGRICIETDEDDLSPYAEILLSCGANGVIQAGHIGPSGPQLAESLGIDATDGVLYATFATGTEATLCLYTMESVTERFQDGICGCAALNVTACPGEGKIISYFSSSQRPQCSQQFPVTRKTVEEDLYCSNKLLTVKIYAYIEASEALPGTMNLAGLQAPQSSIITMTEENQTIAFLISKSGVLNKVHIESCDVGRLYESVDLEVDPSVLNDIHLDQNKEELYIMTKKELIKLNIINCSQHTNCDDCIKPSSAEGDPFCGWCTLEAKCSRYKECPDADGTYKWLRHDAQCVAIMDITPPEHSIQRPPDEINFMVFQLPSPNNNYACRFDDYSNMISKENTGNNFTCMLPPVQDRPQIPEEDDYVTVQLGVYAEETGIVFIQEDYFFYDCSHIKSCTACVNSRWDCEWCVYNNTCTHDSTQCDNDIIITKTNGSSECPQLDLISTEILIPVGVEKNIELQASNLPTDSSRVNYNCLLHIQDFIMTVPVSYFNDSFVQCKRETFSYDASEGILYLPVNISVEFMPNAIIDDANGSTVTLYNCSVMERSCSSCISPSVRPDLQCGWCPSLSMCQLQATCDDDDGFLAPGKASKCPAPQLKDFYPGSGSINGSTRLTVFGTDVGANVTQIEAITVAGTECSIDGLEANYVPGISVDCLTGSVSGEISGLIQMNISNGTTTHRYQLEGKEFMYRDPRIDGFSPSSGIMSGSTFLQITGSKLKTGRHLEACTGDVPCEIQSESVTENSFTCITGNSPSSGDVTVVVRFDGAEREAPDRYTVTEDPTIMDYEPKQTIESGGIILTVTGEGFQVVQNARIDVTYEGETVSESCDVETNTKIMCISPRISNVYASRRRRDASNEASVSFSLDGYTHEPSNLEYVSDPTYDAKNYRLGTAGETITITGTNLDGVDSAMEFIEVCIGPGTCGITAVESTSLSCLTPDKHPGPGGCGGEPITGLDPQQTYVVVRHGENLNFSIGAIQYPASNNTVLIIVGSIAGIIAFCILVFLVCTVFGYRNYRAQIEKTEIEMDTLMTSAKTEVMEGFFIQQEMSDIQDQLSGLGMPFVSTGDYMKSMLFYGLKIKPQATDPENPSEMEERAMVEFSKLLSKKEFLTVLIHTVDGCKSISTQDRANIASLLTVALVTEGKFRYFTDILTNLMTKTIAEASERRRLKQLFKRTETMEDKLLTNWISLAMFKFVKESVGHPLYLLYQALKIQCEKGPVDAVTGQSFLSLNFDTLLTESQDFQHLNLHVEETELGEIPVNVLDVDTITQVKEKILDALYRKKHTKYQRKASEVDLVIRAGKAGQLVVSDRDNTSQPSMGWCELNTLCHYGINDGAVVSLTTKQELPNSIPIPLNEEAENLFNDGLRQSRRVSGPPDGHGSDLILENGVKLYHLTQNIDQEDTHLDDVGLWNRLQRMFCFKGTQGRRKIREIYLQRLVSVKQSIQAFVDDAMDAMFTIREDEYVNNLTNVPFALRFLFNHFDEEASRYENEHEVASTWKNNCLPLRFWATILSHPSFIFNTRQSRTADACVIVLNQMLDNACKGVVPKLKMNSSPSRLLFNRELPKYIDLIVNYYRNIKQTPSLQEEELKQECHRIDIEFQGLFSRLATLRQLYDLVSPHENMLIQALEDDEACSAAHFASSLERVGNTLNQQED